MPRLNPQRAFFRHTCRALLAAGLAVAAVPSAGAARDFRLDARNVTFDMPAPLFTTGTVGGVLTLADTVAPGAAFGLANILGFTLNFGGIIVTFAETMLPGGDITAFGNRSADGASISFLDLRYDLPSTVVPCRLICAGQLEIGTFDPSNFVAIDDADATTTSLVQFDATLVSVPEPGSLMLLGAALGGIAMVRRRGRS